MKKYKLSVLFLPAMLACMPARSQTFNWVMKGGGGSYDRGETIASDLQGRLYIAGTFSGTAAFGSNTLTSAGGTDIVLARYTAAGALDWAIRDGAANNELPVALTTSGNGIYVTGNYYSGGSVIAGTALSTNNGQGGNFLAKYDTSGNPVWAITTDLNANSFVNDIATDALGNIYITGMFQGTSIFGTDTVTAGSNTTSLYIATYDPAGNLTRLITAPADHAEGMGLSFDANDDLYITGYYRGGVDFGITYLMSAPGQDQNLFVAKYDPAGSCLWARDCSGPTSSGGKEIAAAGNGSVYVAGTFNDSVVFNGTTYYDPDLGGLLLKYDALGNLQWVNVIPVYYFTVGGIAVDAQSNCIITGVFSGTVPFGSNVISCSCSELYPEIYVAACRPDGVFDWAQKAGGTSYDESLGIVAEPQGNIYITGGFSNYATFPPLNVLSTGSEDIFVASISNTTGISDVSDGDGLMISPNPSGGVFTINGIAQGSMLRVMNMLGQYVHEEKIMNAPAVIDLQENPAGCYFAEIINGDKRSVRKIIIQ